MLAVLIYFFAFSIQTTTICKPCLTMFINYAQCHDLACIIVCLSCSAWTILLCICWPFWVENLCVVNEDVLQVLHDHLCEIPHRKQCIVGSTLYLLLSKVGLYLFTSSCHFLTVITCLQHHAISTCKYFSLIKHTGLWSVEILCVFRIVWCSFLVQKYRHMFSFRIFFSFLFFYAQYTHSICRVCYPTVCHCIAENLQRMTSSHSFLNTIRSPLLSSCKWQWYTLNEYKQLCPKSCILLFCCA